MSYLIAFMMFCHNTASSTSWTTNDEKSCVSSLLRCHQVLSDTSKNAIDEDRAGKLCLMYESEGGTGAWRYQITNKSARKKWGLD